MTNVGMTSKIMANKIMIGDLIPAVHRYPELHSSHRIEESLPTVLQHLVRYT